MEELERLRLEVENLKKSMASMQVYQDKLLARIEVLEDFVGMPAVVDLDLMQDGGEPERLEK
jgi:hypothetical protein